MRSRSLLSAVVIVAVAPLAAQTSLEDEAVQRAEEYLRINTSNPPGNEDQTMLFFARIFARDGIPFDTASSAPGRGNIWARLKGGSAPALVLLSHIDVVPADARYWKYDPFAATVQDSEIYARGALDTKTLGIVELEAFLSLHRPQLEQPELAALVRNTCSITMLEGSNKINVIPPEADARSFPDANVVPQVSTGFTDSHFFRDLGIHCYGYAPFLVPTDARSGVHGNNERISIANIRRGTTMMRDILDMVAIMH